MRRLLALSRKVNHHGHVSPSLSSCYSFCLRRKSSRRNSNSIMDVVSGNESILSEKDNSIDIDVSSASSTKNTGSKHGHKLPKMKTKDIFKEKDHQTYYHKNVSSSTSTSTSSNNKTTSTQTNATMTSPSAMNKDSTVDTIDSMQGEAIQATQIGAIANVLLAVGKGVIGYIVGSTGLIADGVNSFGDLFGDAVVWYTVVESRKKATPERPWGQGKLEPMGALTVGALLLATGTGIGYNALGVAIDMGTETFPVLKNVHFLFGIYDNTTMYTPEHHHGVHVEEHYPEVVKAPDSQMMNIALGVSCTGVVVKEFLYRYTLDAGVKANSSAVIANAHQHRSDAIVSCAVSAGLVGTMVGYPILDPLAGLLVGTVIIKTAYSTAMSSLRDLSDVTADEEETQKLINECMK